MKKYSFSLVAAVIAVMSFAFTNAPKTSKPTVITTFVYVGNDMSLGELSNPDNWEAREPGEDECSDGSVACAVTINDPTIDTPQELADHLASLDDAGEAQDFLDDGPNNIDSQKP